ncbi:unnamed protein product [Cunninghamella blakesleeana]
MRMLKTNWRSHFMSNISNSNVDIQLIILSFPVGIMDALMLMKLEVFSNNQTGNTVFLGIALSNINSGLAIKWPRNLVSLISFWIAAFLSGQIGHRIGNIRRIWVVLINTFSSLILYVPAILMYTDAISISNNQEKHILLFIMLISFSFGIQAATIRPFKISEIPTVVVTSAMVDLWSDKNLFKKNNLGRNRRLGFIVSLFLGVITGSFLLKTTIEGTIILAASIKLLISLSFIFNKSKTDDLEIE